ncbi:hypothetical protein ACQ9AQ_27235, partial [Escherichia coli]|uniref:hypothetical protein n=1 Tax=Escherichia coli TaxID=562 RepID=UPI003D36FDB5
AGWGLVFFVGCCFFFCLFVFVFGFFVVGCGVLLWWGCGGVVWLVFFGGGFGLVGFGVWVVGVEGGGFCSRCYLFR